MSYRTIDDLMLHLRENGIEVHGADQRRLLLNTGYYHGYKGYRFFKDAAHRISFHSYDEIYNTIQYDSKIKALCYEKVVFIETAVKNIALESIIENIDSERIQDMFDKAISSYKNSPETLDYKDKRRYQQNKLSLQSKIQSILANEYRRNDRRISHFYNNDHYDGVPLWALFEVLTMGNLGFLLQCLTFQIRDDLSRELRLDLSADTNRELIYKYIYALKDLRNAIAHNDVVFDGRFQNSDPSAPMRVCLKHEIGLQYVNFKSIGDYIILICYLLDKLEVSKEETKKFINVFKNCTIEYQDKVSEDVASQVIKTDLFDRLDILSDYL